MLERQVTEGSAVDGDSNEDCESCICEPTMINEGELVDDYACESCICEPKVIESMHLYARCAV